MPKVVFREDFFDGSKRYRKGDTYDIADNVVLPKYDVESIDGKPYDRPRKDYKQTPTMRRSRSAKLED
jgi:hypothetical protein